MKPERQEEENYFILMARHLGARGRRIEAQEAAQAVAALDARQQEAVRLVWLEGLTQSEAARRMDVSQPRVAKMLQQAQTKLRALLTSG